MTAIFLKLLNLSITATWLILAVVLVRLLLKKAPKWISCLLWAFVAIRLICPFSIESVLSLIPSSETIPANIAYMQSPAVHSGISVLNNTVNPIISQNLTPNPGDSANPLQIILPIMTAIWLAGTIVLLIYAVVSWLRLRKTVSASVPVRDNIMACDDVQSPFILGVFKPVIYVPSSLSGQTLDYVMTHEMTHIKRRDYLWKPFGYILMAVYWFNPFCWIAYILLCRDIEMACDEKVIRDMSSESKAGYSQALLDCSAHRRLIAACPLAFGEVGVKQRVKGVLNYKKPAFWIIIVAVIVCIAVAVCFLTNPYSGSISDKLKVSMDMAVAEHNSMNSEENFAAIDYNVLRIKKSSAQTTVYAWVLYEEYSCNGNQVQLESGSHIPTVVTFDTSKKSDSSTYSVIEYWIPRDGNYYADDIRAKFPILLWRKAFDNSCIDEQQEHTRRAAEDYFGISQNVIYNDERPMLIMDGKKYIDPYKPESSLPNGYALSGTLTAEQAYNTGLEGTQYYTNPNEPENFYTYQLCGTPTGIDEVDSANRSWQYVRWISADLDAVQVRKLTLDDVRWLSQKGEALSWDDFAPYQGTEIGSGFYIMQYVIDDMYAVVATGGNNPEKPDSALLINRTTRAGVDIRTDYLEAFIEANTPTTQLISYTQNPDGTYTAENGITYRYLLTLTGRSPNAVCDSGYIVLSNNKELTFERVNESVFTSNTERFLDADEAVIVEMGTVSTFGGVDESSIAYSTTIAYGGYTDEGPVMTGALNAELMTFSSVRHIPIYRLDTKADLNFFRKTFSDSLVLNQGYDEIPSFNDAVAAYDDAFFADHALMLCYIATYDRSIRIGVNDVHCDGENFCVHMTQLNRPNDTTQDNSVCFVIVEVNDADIKNCSSFDAQLV